MKNKKRAIIFVLLILLLLNTVGCTAPNDMIATDTGSSKLPATSDPKDDDIKIPEDKVPGQQTSSPNVPSVWAANCQSHIGMWNAPNGTVIKNIPKGATMELKGWEGKHALVNYQGIEGYVLSSYLMPADSEFLSACLDTVSITSIYTYEQMIKDMQTLTTQYPNKIKQVSIGKSELGRDIPALQLGNLDAQYHVLLQGAVHGREHMTAWLVMALADYWLDYGDEEYSDVCFHLIPMSNPDGVVISQTGVLNQEQLKIYERDKRLGLTSSSKALYAKQWKANGLGIDLNRNFDAGWGVHNDRTGPSSQNYQGESPFSAAEATALRDYTLCYDFDVTLSYHATGSILYYSYGNNQETNAQSRLLAKEVRELTGYQLMTSSGVNGAGYKDWAINELQIPSVTVEIGCESAPLNEREIYSVFARNYRILAAVSDWLR